VLTRLRPTQAITAHVSKYPDWRQTDLAFDKIRAETQAEHDRRSKHEKQLTLGRGQNIAGDILDPAIGSKLNGAHQKMCNEQYEEQPGSNGKPRHYGDNNQEDAGHTNRHCRGDAEGVVEEKRQQEAND